MDFLIKIVLTVAVLSECYVESARLPRLSVAEKSPNEYYYSNAEGIPGAYSFNYDISDERTGNSQYRNEERFSNGTVSGAYGYVDAFGAPQRFRYIADRAGYRVYKEDRFKPFYGYTTTARPIDKVAVEPTESSISWTRPRKPNKKNKNTQNQVVHQKFNNGNRRYNLIGPPSLYVPYY